MKSIFYLQEKNVTAIENGPELSAIPPSGSWVERRGKRYLVTDVTLYLESHIPPYIEVIAKIPNPEDDIQLRNC